MRGILIILLLFVCGICIGRFATIDLSELAGSLTQYSLYILLFFVGISIGCDRERLNMLLRPNPRLLLIPLGTIIGTLLGTVAIAWLVSHRSLWDCLAVGSGFGYYSLSSIMIAEYRGEELATVALMANITREMLAILLAPLWVFIFGPLSLISAGGATTMDTTLPFIARYSGEKFILAAILHGIIVDASVLVLVPLFSTM